MLLITGATGNTGTELMKILAAEGWPGKIRCFVRKESKRDYIDKLPLELEFVEGDLTSQEDLAKAMEGVEAVIHLVNIRFSPYVMAAAEIAGAPRVIMVHTTGRYSKFRDLAEEYETIEEEILHQQKVPFTVLRPTMIYGNSRDRNMHKLVRYLSRHRFFPVFGNGTSQMQPIYVGDLAKAVYLCLKEEKTVNRAYNLSGKAPLEYREIVKLIVGKLNRKVGLVSIPFGLAVALVSVYNVIHPRPKINVEQVRRLQEDKVFSHEDAARDFGFSPMPFEEGIELELNEMRKKGLIG